MSASCYTGCAPGILPPPGHPAVAPHPLAFTGAGPGLDVVAACGVVLVLVGIACLIVVAVHKRRGQKGPIDLTGTGRMTPHERMEAHRRWMAVTVPSVVTSAEEVVRNAAPRFNMPPPPPVPPMPPTDTHPSELLRWRPDMP